jgi:hypothetical protein
VYLCKLREDENSVIPAGEVTTSFCENGNEPSVSLEAGNSFTVELLIYQHSKKIIRDFRF